MLERDLEDAEEQYALAVRQHLSVVDSLLDLQYARVAAMEAAFDKDLKALAAAPLVAPRSALRRSRCWAANGLGRSCRLRSVRERRRRLTLLPSLLPSPPAPFTPRSERAEIVAAHNRRKKDMADVNAAMEAQFGDVEAELKQEFETAWEELKNKNSED